MAEIARLEHIYKTYPNGIRANEDVSLSFEEGEIHAIAGENGAGKSTIMKILYGAEQADEGDIFIRGSHVRITSPKVADSLGIGMVYQHFMLVNQFKVYENIFFGIERRNKLGVLKTKEMIEETKKLCAQFGMPIDPEALTGDLPVGLAQKVEILKVLARGAKLIILDEPTAVLTPQESEELFHQLRLLKTNGKTIVIITHKLDEIKELCDRVSIMKDGKFVGCHLVKDISEKDISDLMVGGEVDLSLNKKPAVVKDVSLEVKNLSIQGRGNKLAVKSVSFSAHQGEILCLAGVEGNGQEETIKALIGLGGNYEGKITLLGQDIYKKNLAWVRKLGVSYIPEDRMKSGSDSFASIYENAISLTFSSHNVAGFIHAKPLKDKTADWINEYQIKGNSKQRISLLSGGNIQKVIVARELGNNPKVLLADQPTRGVDIAAAAFIHRKLLEMRDLGCSIIMVSADLSEVLALADRILVFHNGEISAELINNDGITKEMLGAYMLGLKKKEGEKEHEQV